MSGAEERLGNDPRAELWGEHRSRYRFAAAYVQLDARVLDVATGAGLGLELLEEAGGRPTAVDYDGVAIIDVKRRRRRSRLVQADATQLPFKDEAFDVVTSFETIEHVQDARALVQQIRRVLKSGGHLVLSTPNRAFGPRERHTSNPFHVREFTASELCTLLAEAFQHVRIYGQRPSQVYRFVPFLMIDRDLSPSALAWKLMNRLPFGIKDNLARAVGGRSFYPGEADYWFEPERTDGAHALVVVAR